MKPIFNNVLIICPGGATTAGPEAIHQLCADLNRLGAKSSIAYFPFSKKHETPKAYQKYNVPIRLYEDKSGDLIIFPEIITTYALKVKNAKAAIWWMSVNNFTCERYGNPIRDKLRYFKNLLKGLRPIGGISSLKGVLHFSQSYYAFNFLKMNEIESTLLSDPIPFYTEESYLSSLKNILPNNRSNRILFNPNKGAKFNQYLIDRFKNLEFFPLQGYNRHELAKLFLDSKLYIDFGHHPGKDRLPREAALHGCCVITGVHGSAKNALDVNIPDEYKIDINSENFMQLFETRVNKIFHCFKECSENFENYRFTISNEQIEFDMQILKNFFRHN